MKLQTSTSLLVAAVVIGTIIVIFSAQPNELRISSGDNVIRLAGSVGIPEKISIEKRDDLSGPFTAVISPVYEITPVDTIFPEPLQLIFEYGAAQNPVDLRLAYYDKPLAAWRIIFSEPDRLEHKLIANITRSGLFALAEMPSESFDKEGDALFKQLFHSVPENTVGFIANLAISTQPGDYLIIEDEFKHGGCNGFYRKGNSQSTTSLDRNVKTIIDGEEAEVNLRIQIVWELGQGCFGTDYVE